MKIFILFAVFIVAVSCQDAVEAPIESLPAEAPAPDAEGAVPAADPVKIEYPPPELIQTFQPIHNECKKQTGVTEESIKGFNEGQDLSNMELQCYMHCVFEEAKLTDDKGEIHLEKVLKTLPKALRDIAVNMGKKCLKPEGNTLCEKAFWYNKCWRQNDPKHYFLV